MIWNLYTKELKRNTKNLSIWTSIVVLLTVLTMAMFPYMKDMGASMEGIMKMMPPTMLKAFGIDAQMWSSILGLYNTYYGFYLVLLMGIFSGTNGANAFAKEQREKTAEFLMTKPFTRKQIFVTKMLNVLTLLILIFGIQTFSAYIGIMIFGEENVNWKVFSTMHLHGFILLVFFTSVGVILSMLFKAKLNFMGAIVGLVFGSYFIDAISKAVQKIDWLGYISPNHYLDFNIFTPNYGLNLSAIVFFIVLSIILVMSSYFIFRTKDIT